jgi:hypothetical protein
MEASRLQDSKKKAGEQEEFSSLMGKIEYLMELRKSSEMEEKMQRSKAGRKYFSDSRNTAVKNAIIVALEGAERLADSFYRAELFMASIVIIQKHYGMDEPSKTFRIMHPQVGGKLMEAYSGYLKAAHELMNKETGTENRTQLMANIDYVEQQRKRIAFFETKRS